MKRDLFTTFAKLMLAVAAVFVWFGVLLPYCMRVQNAISVAVGISFAIYAGGVLTLMLIRSLRRRKE